MAQLLRNFGAKCQDKKTDKNQWYRNDAIVAGPADVLFGRGKGSYEWQGNLRYQQIIFYSLPAYTAAKRKQDKTRISNSIVTAVRQSGGRFLKEARDGSLCEVSDKDARDKVAHALRHRRRLCEAQNGSSDVSTGMFTGMFSCSPGSSKASLPCCDAIPSSVWSSRTEETSAIVSNRSDRTENYDVVQIPSSRCELEFPLDEVQVAPALAVSNPCLDNHVVKPFSLEEAARHYHTALSRNRCINTDIHLQIPGGLTSLVDLPCYSSEMHPREHVRNLDGAHLVQNDIHSCGSISLGEAHIDQIAMQSGDQDDSSFDAEVDAVADAAFSDMSSEFSAMDLGGF